MHARVMSAIRINEVCEDYIRRRAMRHLEKGRVVIFAAGTGNPVLHHRHGRSLARHRDQRRHAAQGHQGQRHLLRTTREESRARCATRTLTFDKVLSDQLNVMDATAIVMCRDNNLPLRVFNLNNAGDLTRIVRGEDVGTVVTVE